MKGLQQLDVHDLKHTAAYSKLPSTVPTHTQHCAQHAAAQAPTCTSATHDASVSDT